MGRTIPGRTAWAEWATPLGVGHIIPPGVGGIRLRETGWLSKYPAAGPQLVGSGTRIIGGEARAFGKRNVSGGGHELAELLIRHRRAVHPEALNLPLVNRLFLGIEVFRPHQKHSVRDPDHYGGSRGRRDRCRHCASTDLVL